MSEENNNKVYNHVTISVIIILLFTCWWLWSYRLQIKEKHVRFSDDIGINDYIRWLKKW